MYPNFKTLITVATLLLEIAAPSSCHVSDNDTTFGTEAESPRILSRRKRFLVFPEGSSLQLVFCMTHPSVAVIGDIFLWGNTAALAWELPQDPYSPFDHLADPLHRRQDTVKNIYYTDDKGKLLFKVPYKRKPIVNPAFAKRSVDNIQPAAHENSNNDTTNRKHEKDEAVLVDRKLMHDSQVKRDFLKMEHLDVKAIDFHRLSRKGLYEKLEVFVKALGMNGRQCVLRTLCEVGQSRNDSQGSFVDELMRAVFTLPHGHAFEKTKHQEYDLAHSAEEDCSQIYPECEASSAPIGTKLT